MFRIFLGKVFLNVYNLKKHSNKLRIFKRSLVLSEYTYNVKRGTINIY